MTINNNNMNSNNEKKNNNSKYKNKNNNMQRKKASNQSRIKLVRLFKVVEVRLTTDWNVSTAVAFLM